MISPAEWDLPIDHDQQATVGPATPAESTSATRASETVGGWEALVVKAGSLSSTPPMVPRSNQHASGSISSPFLTVFSANTRERRPWSTCRGRRSMGPGSHSYIFGRCHPNISMRLFLTASPKSVRIDRAVGLDRLTLDGSGGTAIDTDGHIAAQRDAIELTIEIKTEDVARGEVGSRAIVPEGDATRLPAEAHGVFRPGDVLEQQFKKLLVFTRFETGDALQEGRAVVWCMEAGERSTALVP
jgi:hypothetical protein